MPSGYYKVKWFYQYSRGHFLYPIYLSDFSGILLGTNIFKRMSMSVLLNLLCPGNIIWHHRTWSTLVQVMACCLLPKPVLTCCQLKPQGQTSVKLEWKHKHFHSRNTFENVVCKIVAILLTHWGWVTHICVSKLSILGSDNGLSPGRCQAII